MPDLSRYYAKRSADQTPEPFGHGTEKPGLFVVQKHAARRTHFDFRLELDGLLKSWAVPHGPSLDPNIKRLAVKVEDHPVEYADFEGQIPDGNYGAGAVIVWDRGQWIALEDPHQGFEKGKLLFELRGYKLRGVFTLVKTKGNKGEWLLIKKPDAWAAAEGERPLPQGSIFSGLTVEEMEAGIEKNEALRKQMQEANAPAWTADFAQLEPMLAEPADAPFSRPGWLYELKYDGYRLLVEKREKELKLRYRSGVDATGAFPEVSRSLSSLPFSNLILDGEVVVLQDDGKPSFNRLQQRVQLSRQRDIERATVEHPATYFVFDLLAFGGLDLRGLPLTTRKAWLKALIPATGPLRFSDHVEQKGAELFELVRARQLEGVVAKNGLSSYRSGRFSDWQKFKVERTDEFIVVGFSPPEKTRVGFGGLHLARWEGGELVYAGRVGSGFSHEQLLDLRAYFDTIVVSGPPCKNPKWKTKQDRWIAPRLVVEVRFMRWTEDNLLREPVFLRVRDDKKPEDLKAASEPVAVAPKIEADDLRTVPFTNLDKLFWPEDKLTKGDLVAFYRSVAPWLLFYLQDRPLVLTRFPDGIHGKNFYQKDAPPFIPGWLRTERMWSEHAQREIDYFVCDDEASLLYVVNMGSIPLHVWSSRVADLQHPDWSIIDLDPKGAPFSDVMKISLELKSLCDQLDLPCFIKTSGSTGLHLLIPLGRQCTYEQSKLLAELLARVIASRLPEIATLNRSMNKRDGKVYLDFLQNRHGQVLVAPFSVRPLAGAPVSMTLTWDEITPDLTPTRFNLHNALQRLQTQGDPLRAILDLRPDFLGALNKLSVILKS